jgi:cold shock CspA family protein
MQAFSNPSLLKFPKRLVLADRFLTLAGAGRTPNGVCYFDAQTGAFLELYGAVVMKNGPAFALAQVTGNAAFNAVRVDAIPGIGVPPLGASLIIGPITYPDGKPAAANAWLVQTGAAPTTRTGVYIEKAPDWGWIVCNDGLPDAFLHVSALAPGQRMDNGARVTFTPIQTPKGVAAKNVRRLA